MIHDHHRHRKLVKKPWKKSRIVSLFNDFTLIMKVVVNSCWFFKFMFASTTMFCRPEWEASIRLSIRHSTFLSNHHDRTTRIDENAFPFCRGTSLRGQTRLWALLSKKTSHKSWCNMLGNWLDMILSLRSNVWKHDKKIRHSLSGVGAPSNKNDMFGPYLDGCSKVIRWYNNDWNGHTCVFKNCIFGFGWMF